VTTASRYRGGLNRGWWYITWPFATLEATRESIAIRSPIGSARYPRESIRLVVWHRGWSRRGVCFEAADEDHANFYGFLAANTPRLLADLRRLGWPVAEE